LQAGDLPAARAQADRAVTAAQDDRVAARSALEEEVRQLGDAVGNQAPIGIEATRALAALGRP